MLFSAATVLLSSALVASAADLNVIVGDQNALVFNPPSVNAQVGDNIIFEFVSKNHSVTQSTFATPCVHTPGSADSGFQFVADPAGTHFKFNITVNDPAPLWFFCAQTNPVPHCGMGMVFAVNPTADKTFEMYQNNAKSSANGGAAPSASGVSGGIIPPPSTLPTGGVVPGASSPIASGGFSTALGGFSTAGGASSTAGSLTPTNSAGAGAAPNGALAVRGASSGAAVGAVALFAAAAGLLL